MLARICLVVKTTQSSFVVVSFERILKSRFQATKLLFNSHSEFSEIGFPASKPGSSVESSKRFLNLDCWIFAVPKKDLWFNCWIINVSNFSFQNYSESVTWSWILEHWQWIQINYYWILHNIDFVVPGKSVRAPARPGAWAPTWLAGTCRSSRKPACKVHSIAMDLNHQMIKHSSRWGVSQITQRTESENLCDQIACWIFDPFPTSTLKRILFPRRERPEMLACGSNYQV